MSKKKPRLPGTMKKESAVRRSAPNIGPEDEVDGYTRVDVYDDKTIARIGTHYGDILRSIGEDPAREGLQKTPERVAKALHT